MKKYTALLLTFLLLSTMMPLASMQAMPGKGAEGSSKKSDKDKDRRDRDRFRRAEDRARDRDEPIKDPYGLHGGVQDPIHVSKPTEGVPDDSGPPTSRQERVREYADTEVTRHVQEITRLEGRMRLALQHGKSSEWEKERENLLQERRALGSHLDQLKRSSASGEDVERLIIENNARIAELEAQKEPSTTVPTDKKGKQIAKPGIGLPHSLKKFKEGVSKWFKPAKVVFSKQQGEKQVTAGNVEEVPFANVAIGPAGQMLEATEAVLGNQYGEIQDRLADRYEIFLEDSRKYDDELDEIGNLQQKLLAVGLEDEPAKFLEEIKKELDKMDKSIGDLGAIRSDSHRHDPEPDSAVARVRRFSKLRRFAAKMNAMETPFGDLAVSFFSSPDIEEDKRSLREMQMDIYNMLHVLVKKEKEGQVLSNEDKDFLQSMDQKFSAYERALYKREFADMDKVSLPVPALDVKESQTMSAYLWKLLRDGHHEQNKSLASLSRQQVKDDVKDFIAKASDALGIPMSPEFTHDLHESPFESLRMIEHLLRLLKQKPDLQAGMKEEIRGLRYALREWLGIAAGEEWEGGRISDFPRAVKALSDARVRDWFLRTKGEGMYYREGDKRVGLKYLKKVFGGGQDIDVEGHFVVPEGSEAAFEVVPKAVLYDNYLINPYTKDKQKIQMYSQAVNQPFAGIPNTRYYLEERITGPDDIEELSDGKRVFVGDTDRRFYLVKSDKEGRYITRQNGTAIRLREKDGKYFGDRAGEPMEFVLDVGTRDPNKNQMYAFPADSVTTGWIEAGVKKTVNRKGKTVNLSKIYPVWLAKDPSPTPSGPEFSTGDKAYVLPYDSVPGFLREDEKGFYFKKPDGGRVDVLPDVLPEQLNHFVETSFSGKAYLEKFSIGSEPFVAEPGLMHAISTQEGQKYTNFEGKLYPIETGSEDISPPEFAVGLPETSKYIRNEQGKKRPVWFITTEQGNEKALMLPNFYKEDKGNEKALMPPNFYKKDRRMRTSFLPHHIPYPIKTSPGDSFSYINRDPKRPEERLYIWSLKNN